MFTQKRRHSPFGSLRRPAYLAALFVVIGVLAAINALPTFAMPIDPIDPPDFEGNPEYVAPAGASRSAEPLATSPAPQLPAEPQYRVVERWRGTVDSAIQYSGRSEEVQPCMLACD